MHGKFQSTRPLRGGTMMSRHPTPRASISIHPPLAGRDSGRRSPRRLRPISIHPPLAGRDKKLVQAKYTVADFNPPAPCGAGRSGRLLRRGRRDFNPPAPCGAGPSKVDEYAHKTLFQSTRPLRGGTQKTWRFGIQNSFQSTRPLRGGTAILHKKTVQNIAYCTKSAFTLAVLSGFLALMRPFFCQTCTNFGANLPKNRCSLPVRTLIPSGPPPADSRH